MAEKRNTEKTEVEGLELAQMDGLPTPEILAKYEKIVPGGAARLLELVVAQARHDREIARRTLDAELKLEKFKQITRFAFALCAGVLGGALLLNGSELTGLILALAGIGLIVIGTIKTK